MNKTLLGIVVLSAIAPALFAQHASRPPDEAAGVQNRRGDASPNAGLTAGQGNSRIDDYFNQDEQINIDPDTGVVKVLRVNQKNLINDYVVATYPLKNVTPRELRDVMRVVTGKEGGNAEVILDQETNEQFLQVICPKFQLPWIEAAVQALDVGWLQQARDGTQTVRYFSKFRPSESLVTIADFYAGEGDDGDGSTQSDPNLNFISRRDDPFHAQTWLAACNEYDVPPPQALLQFQIYEVDTSNDLKLGVDWIAWKNGPGRSLFEVLYSSQNSHHRIDNASGFFDPNVGAFTVFGDGSFNQKSTQYLLSANYLMTSAFLDFLRVKGKARTLARPELFAFSHKLATWKSTDQFLAFEVTPDDPGPNGLVPARLNKLSVSGPLSPFHGFDQGSDWAAHNRFLRHRIRGEVGLELNVVAAVGLEQSEVEIELISSEMAGTTPQGTPILTNRRIVTKIRLKDGQPYVFGGMTREEDVEASNKAPWLGDIPVLGYLFGQENTTKRRKEMIVTVVPHFYHGAPKDVVDPVLVDTRAMAKGEAEIAMPDNSYAFDEWLFDTMDE